MQKIRAILYTEYGGLDGCNSNCRFWFVASGMDSNPPLGFTEEEYMALARQKYNELKALKDKPTWIRFSSAYRAFL